MPSSHFKIARTYLSNTRRTYLNRHLKLCEKGSELCQKYALRIENCRPSRRCLEPACPQCWDYKSSIAISEAQKAFGDVPVEHVFHITVLFKPRTDLFHPRHCGDEFTAFKKRIQKKFRRPDFEETILHGRFEVDVKDSGETDFLRATQPVSSGLVITAVSSADHRISLACETASKIFVPHFHGLVAVHGNSTWRTANQIRSLIVDVNDHPDTVRVARLRQGQEKLEAISKFVGYTHKGFTDGFKGELLEQYVRFHTEVRPNRLRLQINRSRSISSKGNLDEDSYLTCWNEYSQQGGSPVGSTIVRKRKVFQNHPHKLPFEEVLLAKQNIVAA